MENSMKALPPEGSALSTELRVRQRLSNFFRESFRSKSLARLAVAVNAAIAVLLISTAAHAGPEQPNVLLIICDDCGYGDVTPALTPSLSSLASESARFDNGYANALCSPTRAAMYTGRYSERARVLTAYAWNAAGGMALSEVTLAEQLKAVGYRTALIGKWHLGNLNIPQGNPLLQGYDEFFGSRFGAIHPFTHRIPKSGTPGVLDWWRNNELLPGDTRYSVHAVTQESIGFIERNAGRPWFLTVAYHAIHAPRLGPNGQTDYVGMLRAMDQGIGQILLRLRETLEENNTVVWFISDNGGYPNARNAGLRGEKGTLWEGGIRVPTFVRWPGHVQPGARSGVTHVTDFMPTILDIIGAQPARAQDGRSQYGVLVNGGALPQRPQFWSQKVANPNLAVRDGDWKFLRQASVPYLFNLAADRGEQRNLAASMPAKAQTMQAQINAWRTQVGR